MEKEISELAYKETASITKKEKTKGIETRFLFLLFKQYSPRIRNFMLWFYLLYIILEDTFAKKRGISSICQ
jgi:hypothetical protein